MGTAAVTWWPLPASQRRVTRSQLAFQGALRDLSARLGAQAWTYQWPDLPCSLFSPGKPAFKSPCGGGLSKDRPSCGLLGSFLPALRSGLAFFLSRRAMGSGNLGRGQGSGFWSSHCCCFTSHPGDPFGTHTGVGHFCVHKAL